MGGATNRESADFGVFSRIARVAVLNAHMSLWNVAVKTTLLVTAAAPYGEDASLSLLALFPETPTAPAANRHLAQFDRAGKVAIDREVNRQAALGLGIHRCVGSHWCAWSFGSPSTSGSGRSRSSAFTTHRR